LALEVAAAVVGVPLLYAEQLAVMPPFAPPQVQYQGPLPVGVDAVPALQRFVVEIVVSVAPLLLPQAPFVAVTVWTAPLRMMWLELSETYTLPVLLIVSPHGMEN
jgi:hypothetical protein